MEQRPLSTLTSPTNESYSALDSNLKRLENSSVASNGLHQQSPSLTGKIFLEFEQFKEGRNRKDTNLSIKIDENFDCRMIDAPGIRNLHKKPIFEEIHEKSESSIAPIQREYDSHQSQHLKLIVEYREKIEQMSEQMIRLEGQLSNSDDEIRRMKMEAETNQQDCSDLQLKNEHLKQIIRKRDETISAQKDMLESFSKKLNDLERDTSNVKLYEERMNDKDMKLRDSTRKADKLTTINKTLTKELKDASLKIMQLEKEMQVVVCSQLQEHRSKLKESAYMNKQNNVEEGNYRKSFEGVKRQQSKTFTHNTTSGTLKPASGHILQKRVKSISNIHKLKY